MAECNLVVLFDLKRNVKSYIQSRGRARHASSRLLVLASADGGDEDLLRNVRPSRPAARRLRASELAQRMTGGRGESATA